MPLPLQPDNLSQQSSITWRAVIIGFVVVLIFCPFVVYAYTVTQSTDLASDHSTIAAVFFLVVLIVFVNVVWIRLFRGRGLNRAELLTVYIMLIMPSAVATLGVCESLLPMLVAPVYQKSAGDRYQKVVMKYVSNKILVTDKEAAKEFMERLPRKEGESLLSWLRRIRWKAFARPVSRWLVFLIALQLAVLCLATIFRRQWVERELLPFPLARLPIMLTEKTEPASVLPDIFRNKMLYWGALLPALITTLQAIHYYYPNFPAPARPEWKPQILGFVFKAKFNFVMFGFAYLVSLASLRGIWLWALIFIVFQAICFRFGVKFPEKLGSFGASNNALIYHSGMGGLIVFAGYSIWVARRHLRDVFAKAFGADDAIDDSGELMTYRLAVLGGAASFGVMVLWAVRYGIPFGAALMMLSVAVVTYLAMSKIVAEVGLAECLPSGVPGVFTISKLGPHNIGYAGVLNMTPHIAWAGDMRTFTMANATNGMRLTCEFGATRTKRFVAFFGSVTLGLVVSLLTTYLIGNATGKINTGPTHHAKSLPRGMYDYSLEVLMYKQTPWAPRRHFAIGASPKIASPKPKPPKKGLLAPPVLLTPRPDAALNTVNPVFEWKPIEGADRYVIEISEAKRGRILARGWVKETRYTYGSPLGGANTPPKPLKPGQTYRWRVRMEMLHGPNKFGWYATFSGMVLAGVLMFLQRRVLWWPLPATGFVIGGAWIMQHVWFAVFVAWVVKTLVLRYGGASAYRKSLPFFMGLIAGQLFTLGAWAVIDILTAKRGNKLFAF